MCGIMSEENSTRVLAIHDISCFGRCSLTVALPIVSAAGLECTILPNSMLSTHTAIKGFTYHDLTSDMVPIADHWKQVGLRFGTIYTGYLCNKEQVDIVCGIVDDFGKDAFIFVDPAMADNGSLYPLFGPEFPGEIARLCAKADVIKPNITEACLLTGTEYRQGPYTEEWIGELVGKLRKICDGKIILTGVHYDDKRIGAIAVDSDGSTEFCSADFVPQMYHGSGDVFSAAAVGALGCGFSLKDATQIAVDFTEEAVRRTYESGADIRFGVDFEKCFPSYLRALGKL